MNNFKGLVLLVALCAIGTASAQTMLNGNNYRQFSNQYRGYLITPQNTLDLNWTAGAVAALRADGMYRENNFPSILWGEVEPMVNYQAQLPQNRNNPDFKGRIRESLIRQLQGIVTPQYQAQAWSQQASAPVAEPVVNREREEIQRQRNYYIAKGLNSVYNNGVVQEMWLRDILRAVLSGASLTASNIYNIEHEMIGNTRMVVANFFEQDPSLGVDQRNRLYQDVARQVGTFVRKQLATSAQMRGRQ